MTFLSYKCQKEAIVGRIHQTKSEQLRQQMKKLRSPNVSGQNDVP